jgi:hypothetical protein
VHDDSIIRNVSIVLSNISEPTFLRYYPKIVSRYLPRKEVIHPQLPLRIPCYDLTPVIQFTLGRLKRRTSGAPDFRGLTGGEYKTRERIHRGVLTHGY